jgi:hypothetical protein
VLLVTHCTCIIAHLCNAQANGPTQWRLQTAGHGHLQGLRLHVNDEQLVLLRAELLRQGRYRPPSPPAGAEDALE